MIHTGITGGTLLSGMHDHGRRAITESVVLRCEIGTRRLIPAEYLMGGT